MRKLFRICQFAVQKNKRIKTENLRILELDPRKNHDIAEIKKAYVRLAKSYHPDVSKLQNSPEKFQQISNAYKELLEELSDPQKFKETQARKTGFEQNYSQQTETPRPRARRTRQQAYNNPFDWDSHSNNGGYQNNKQGYSQDPWWHNQFNGFYYQNSYDRFYEKRNKEYEKQFNSSYWQTLTTIFYLWIFYTVIKLFYPAQDPKIRHTVKEEGKLRFMREREKFLAGVPELSFSECERMTPTQIAMLEQRKIAKAPDYLMEDLYDRYYAPQKGFTR